MTTHYFCLFCFHIYIYRLRFKSARKVIIDSDTESICSSIITPQKAESMTISETQLTEVLSNAPDEIKSREDASILSTQTSLDMQSCFDLSFLNSSKQVFDLDYDASIERRYGLSGTTQSNTTVVSNNNHQERRTNINNDHHQERRRNVNNNNHRQRGTNVKNNNHHQERDRNVNNNQNNLYIQNVSIEQKTNEANVQRNEMKQQEGEKSDDNNEENEDNESKQESISHDQRIQEEGIDPSHVPQAKTATKKNPDHPPNFPNSALIRAERRKKGTNIFLLYILNSFVFCVLFLSASMDQVKNLLQLNDEDAGNMENWFDL